MREILTILERDARTSPERIAEMTGKSVDQVRGLISEAERSGVIRRYKTVIDWEIDHYTMVESKTGDGSGYTVLREYR